MANSKQEMTKETIIEKLGLEPLPGEGGYYRETYRSDISVPASSVGISGDGKRSLGTAIYYLVTQDEFSALHRLKGDEIFHFYAGDPVEMLQILENGESRRIILGTDILNDQRVQVVVPRGIWQGTRLCEGGSWALLGTTTAPGFDFADFELGARNHLQGQFPLLDREIERFTR